MRWFLQLLSLGLILCTDRAAGAAQPCTDSGRFGFNCRYKCHCNNKQCDNNNGECNPKSTCENGWFGPACQYVDLVTTNATSKPDWVDNYSDTRCNTGQETVTIAFDRPFYFTWLRLSVNTTVSPKDFNLQLMDANGIAVDCSNMSTSAVNDTLLDIHCQQGTFFQKLNITGAGVKWLCSVMVSGGRNVALGQNTTQTSILERGNSDLAVNGDKDNDYSKGSCTHTDYNDATPTWTLTFQRPYHVNRYAIYNRGDHEQQRIIGFFLKAVEGNGSVAFTYIDHNNISLDIYTISSTTPWLPVSSVNITATHNNINPAGIFLTLCEVEMFGDTVCPAGNYGRDCNKSCNCAKSGDSCFVSTGGCPSGCAAGYHWEECQTPCDKTHFGVDCLQNCSTNCTNQLCLPNNGTCLSCIPGKQGPLCDSNCNPMFWGENCTRPCQTDCKDQSCDAVTGKCLSCVAGRSGDNCDQVCDQTHFGVDCLQNCSTNCTKQLCLPNNGTCLSCISGKQGPLCDSNCKPTFWGENCTTPCQADCKDQLCDAVTGKCISCVAGRSGDNCDQACNATYHGENCALPCSSDCTDQHCNATNGHCQSCLIGKYGIFCNEALPVQATGPGTDESPNVAVIVGPVVAFVVLVALIVMGVLIWRRRRHKNNVPEQTNPRSVQNYENIDSVRTMEPNAVTPKPNNIVEGQAKPPAVMKKPASSQGHKDGQVNHVSGDYYNHLAGRSETAIKFDDLDNFMAAHKQEFYQEQFNSIPVNNSATTTVAQSAENQSKNRYKNINAYDHSRVHLQTDVLKNHGDYINASYIDGYKQKKQFIASQGPTKIILEDFVRMLWEQEVQVVVMLTNLVEEGKLKCEQYWPDDGEVNIGEITVKLTTTQVFADYTIRRLCLYKTPQHVQILTHFHFTTWPDKDVPTTAWGLVDLEQRVASIATSKPIVVHCSAGVGRTGTFIALHNILEEIKHTGYLDVFTTVQKLRQDRINMVQTFQQYELLHRATQVAMVCRDTTVTLNNLRDRVQLLEQKSESGQSLLEKEFKSLCLVCGEDEYNEEEEEVQENNTYYNSLLLNNRMKNRLHNVLPREFNRPILRCETENLGDYINAVLVPSCKKHDHQILTQLPLPTTVVDFWRLMTQYKVSLIVAFERDLSTEDMTIGDYLPESEGETKTCSFLNITTTGLKSVDAWDVHRLTVTANEEIVSNVSFKGEYNLSHLTWKNKDLDSRNLLKLMEKIRAMKPAGEGRTLFTCRNGAEWSGLAYTLSLLLDRMDNDQHVSVPLVVGTVKAIRPQIIPTLDQYRLLHQVLHIFTEANNEYSNFSNT